ncbi:cytochrome c-type biogenesis protein [Azonexus sp. R2A61]|uniref:cytochrome c-type biogenesis protein n=1 Tax=Azonexus sp. R2A61 TaxID=2744443 RepID=UPI001F3BCD5B|nr:cytochrome c-type biogenesis protein [Azonexus sp. R2A61]
MKRFILLFALFVASTAAFASSAGEAAVAADPVAEKRLQALSKELRCLVCQNETLADSNAELAVDLRREIRGMIHEGRSDAQIVEFLVARYGDFVLYRPPVQANTLLLWGGPLVLFVIGLIALVRYLRRRNDAIVAAERPLSTEESRRATELLKETDPK